MSNTLEIAGTIKVINDTQTFASGFTKREFVITTHDDKYPQDLKFETVKAGCDRLDAYRVGDGIKVSFNLRGNEYNGKYYVALQAWKLEKGESDGLGARSPEHGREERRSAEQGGAKPPANVPDDFQEDDDIPF